MGRVAHPPSALMAALSPLFRRASTSSGESGVQRPTQIYLRDTQLEYHHVGLAGYRVAVAVGGGASSHPPSAAMGALWPFTSAAESDGAINRSSPDTQHPSPRANQLNIDHDNHEATGVAVAEWRQQSTHHQWRWTVRGLHFGCLANLLLRAWIQQIYSAPAGQILSSGHAVKYHHVGVAGHGRGRDRRRRSQQPTHHQR